MTTTNLFVELVVIGVGAALWVCSLVLAVFGVDWLGADIMKTYPMLVSLLAVVYLLGIITDRVADYVFDKLFSSSLRQQHFCEKRTYQDARRLVFNNSDRLAGMHEYGRTRLRICRGWAVNSVLIAGSVNIMLYCQFSDTSWYRAGQLMGTLGFVLLSILSWWSWRLLCLTEYLKVKEHAEFLERHRDDAYHKLAA